MEDEDIGYHILKMSNICTLNLSLYNMGNIYLFMTLLNLLL